MLCTRCYAREIPPAFITPDRLAQLRRTAPREAAEAIAGLAAVWPVDICFACLRRDPVRRSEWEAACRRARRMSPLNGWVTRADRAARTQAARVLDVADRWVSRLRRS